MGESPSAVEVTDAPSWVPFVDDLRSADVKLEHPACFTARDGLEALLDVIRQHDQRESVARWQLMDKLEHYRDDDRKRLKELWDVHMSLKFPGLRAAELVLPEGQALDLVDAEGGIAGHVQTYLERGRIRFQWILFDPLAHERALQQLRAADRPELAATIEYASVIGEMATTVSRVSGVPLRPKR